MPLTKQSPIQNQGSQPLMSTRGVVENENGGVKNKNTAPSIVPIWSLKDKSWFTDLSPEKQSDVTRYHLKRNATIENQIQAPKDEPNNSFSSINDSYNKMFSDYQKHSFDPLEKPKDEYKNDPRFDYEKGKDPLWDQVVSGYGNVNRSEFAQFEKAEGYKKDLLKNPATSLFDERKNYISKLDNLWTRKGNEPVDLRSARMRAQMGNITPYKIKDETPASFVNQGKTQSPTFPSWQASSPKLRK